VNQPRPKTARIGCSIIAGPVVFGAILYIIFFWPGYIDKHGTAAAGVISDKYESIRIVGGDWTRRFQVIATYSIPGRIVRNRAICDVDEKTYDSLHPGSSTTVHYFAALLQQPFLPATNIAPCSSTAFLVLHSKFFPVLAITAASLLIILFLWKVFRVKMFTWLLFVWLAFAFFYFVIPHVEPQPAHPVATTATIDLLVNIKNLGGINSSRSIRLQHPYQIVVLQFIPPGKDTAVRAVDKIDMGSVPSLQAGQNVNIAYDARNPRVARLQEGTRLFPGQALTTVTLVGCVFVLLVAIGIAILRFLRHLGQRSVKAAQEGLAQGQKFEQN